MRIAFSIRVETTLTPEAVCEGIFDVDRWAAFQGYGPIPGIRKATRTAPGNPIVGMEVSVQNLDGSKHLETIEFFDPHTCLVMRIQDFISPLGNLASHFIERWDFSEGMGKHQITRTFEMYPKSVLALPVLWVVSLFLRKAVRIHTQQMATPTET